jgi:hypothetical protein
MTFSASPSVAEIGSTVALVILNWTLSNITATSQVITGSGITGSVSVSPGTLTYLVNGPFTSNSSWSININSGTLTATATLSFNSKRYWGVNASASLSNSDILALPGTLSGGSDFTPNFDLTVFYNCSGGPNYPYFCFPASYGIPTNVTVSGLSFTSFTTTPQSFTNASGYTTTYNVIRFNFLQTGASIKTVWA